MNPLVVDIGIAFVSVAVFLAGYGAALVATRPARPRIGNPTPDLGDEPPAVVNLLANRWRLNEDATESTLLDLAARRHIELRQPDNDPMHTTIHLRPAQDADPAPLTRYEQRVLDRVRGLAVDGVLPVTALTFRNASQAKAWERRLRAEVLTDAHARGLSRRRFGAGIISALGLLAAFSTLGVVAATIRWELRVDSEEAYGTWIEVGVVCFIVLSGMVGAIVGERDTGAGLAAATRWLGVREWLRRHEEFADLPPAAVMVWDRYLPYGAALGVTHTASMVLDLGLGNRKLVWSSHGGSWHRVRVRYPPRIGRYGLKANQLIGGSLISLALGTALLWAYNVVLPNLDLADLAGPRIFGDVPLLDFDTARFQDVAERVLLAVAILLLARGVYRIVRTLLDLANVRSVTGEVLWQEVWRSKSGGENSPKIPWLHYLAVDDGSDDRTTAWALPDALSRKCSTGDTVTIRVRPWSRRIVQLTVDNRGQAHELAAVARREDLAEHTSRVGGSGVRSFVQAITTPGISAARVLTGQEVGRATGLPVGEPDGMPTPGMSSATFVTSSGKPVLLVQVADGRMSRWAWKANAKGTAVPAIGDGAYTSGDRAAARIGDTTILLTLMGDGRRARPALPSLLAQAAARVPRPATLE